MCLCLPYHEDGRESGGIFPRFLEYQKHIGMYNFKKNKFRFGFSSDRCSKNRVFLLKSEKNTDTIIYRSKSAIIYGKIIHRSKYLEFDKALKTSMLK